VSWGFGPQFIDPLGSFLLVALYSGFYTPVSVSLLKHLNLA